MGWSRNSVQYFHIQVCGGIRKTHIRVFVAGVSVDIHKRILGTYSGKFDQDLLGRVALSYRGFRKSPAGTHNHHSSLKGWKF